MGSPAFLGAWLVSEYVYNPDGAFVGIVHQHRRLERRADGGLRVIQFCEPPDFRDHPLADRVGEYVFDVRVVGRARRYLGPDVIGGGRTWGDGALTGRGVWPGFGCDFTSFSVQTGPERQITGGRFFTATQPVADLVGLATAAAGAAWPEFIGPDWPGAVSADWQGVTQTYASDGSLTAEAPAARRYAGWGWDEADGRHALSRAGARWRYQAAGLTGLAVRRGWLTQCVAFGEAGRRLTGWDVLDGADRALVGMRCWHQDDALERVEVIRLNPA